MTYIPSGTNPNNSVVLNGSGQLPAVNGSQLTNVPPGIADVFDVTQYGATGNGTTDDTTAINTAIAALNTKGAGWLWFPKGTYKVTTNLTSVTGVAIISGTGALGSTIQGPNSWTMIGQVVIQNLTIESNTASPNLLMTCSASTVDNILFIGSTGRAIQIDGNGIAVRNCSFNGCSMSTGHHGIIYLQGSASPSLVNIIDNYFGSCTVTADSDSALIAVSANTTQFAITGNLADNTNTAHVGINIATGTSDDYIIALNSMRIATTAVSDNGSGTNKQIALNL